MKDSFILYTSFYEPIQILSVEEKALLLEMIFEHHRSGNIPETDSIPVKILWLMIKQQFDRDGEKYDRVVERNQENGRKGGRPPKNPKNPLGYKETQTNPTEPKKPDNDNVYDTVNDNVYDTVNKSDLSFENVWTLYDKKVGDKEKLRKKWDKLSISEKNAVLDYIPRYIAAVPAKQYRKNFETFLNNKSWNDEIIESEIEESNQNLLNQPPVRHTGSLKPIGSNSTRVKNYNET